MFSLLEEKERRYKGTIGDGSYLPGGECLCFVILTTLSGCWRKYTMSGRIEKRLTEGVNRENIMANKQWGSRQFFGAWAALSGSGASSAGLSAKREPD
jgi:hypothetical protein